ncbi:MAG TPA: hypothetical protein VHE10_03830 [Candidatus Paceibacterota bacterium]|nr:hypothetical protein [Candidatus Paceibacterota bacterium]
MKIIQTSYAVVGSKDAKGLVITKFRIKGLRLRRLVKVPRKK